MEWLSEIARTNVTLSVLVFVLVRAIAIIVPPIPGAIMDIAAVQVLGWKEAFIFSEIGTMLGAMIAFNLGRRLRNTSAGMVLIRWLHIERIHEWERRLPPADQFWGWVAFRLPTNAAFDYISYAAGLSNCNMSIFFWSTLIGNVPVVFTFFLLAGFGLQQNLFFAWLLPLIFVAFVSIPVTIRLRKKMRDAEEKSPHD